MKTLSVQRRVHGLCLMIVACPALTLAVEMDAIGLSFGGSWMTQEYKYVEEIDFQGVGSKNSADVQLAILLLVTSHKNMSISAG